MLYVYAFCNFNYHIFSFTLFCPYFLKINFHATFVEIMDSFSRERKFLVIMLIEFHSLEAPIEIYLYQFLSRIYIARHPQIDLEQS